MPKTKWDGADQDPTINHFYKIDNRTFGICS